MDLEILEWLEPILLGICLLIAFIQINDLKIRLSIIGIVFIVILFPYFVSFLVSLGEWTIPTIIIGSILVTILCFVYSFIKDYLEFKKNKKGKNK